MLARFGTDVSNGAILHGKAENDRRKIRLRVVASGLQYELNNFAHENSSDTAMTTRPTSASDIRQALISPKIKNVRHDRGAGADHFGREPYPVGAACGGDDPRRGPTCSRMPANCVKARTTARSRRPGGGVGSFAASICGRRPIRNIPNKKARGGFLRAGFSIFVMMYFCP
jgi:hypothetical protein